MEKPPENGPSTFDRVFHCLACGAPLCFALGNLVFLALTCAGLGDSMLFVSGGCAFLANISGLITLLVTAMNQPKSRWLPIAPLVFVGGIPTGFLGCLGCKLGSLHSEAAFFAFTGFLSGFGFLVSVVYLFFRDKSEGGPPWPAA